MTPALHAQRALAQARRSGALRPTAVRRARPGPRPLDPRTALLQAHKLGDAVALAVEQLLAEALAPLLAEHLPIPIAHRDLNPENVSLAERYDAPVNLPRGPRGPLWNRPARRRPSIAEAFGEQLERVRGPVLRLVTRERLEQQLERIADSTSRHVLTEMRRQFQAQIGVDPITSDAGLSGARAAFVRANVERITTVATRRIGEVERLVSEAVSRGTRVEVLARQLEETGEVSRRRASLIARDQVLTLNAQMARLRMQNAGVTEYIHSTSRDERVRPTHKALEGTRQRFDNPPLDPETGEAILPGEPIGCRCTARPVLEGLL